MLDEGPSLLERAAAEADMWLVRWRRPLRISSIALGAVEVASVTYIFWATPLLIMFPLKSFNWWCIGALLAVFGGVAASSVHSHVNGLQTLSADGGGGLRQLAQTVAQHDDFLLVLRSFKGELASEEPVSEFDDPKLRHTRHIAPALRETLTTVVEQLPAGVSAYGLANPRSDVWIANLHAVFVTHGMWRPVVALLISEAPAIVVTVSGKPSSGLRFELDRISATGANAKTVILNALPHGCAVRYPADSPPETPSRVDLDSAAQIRAFFAARFQDRR